MVVARSEPDICAVPAFIMRIRGISDLGATLFDGKAPTMINSQLPCSHRRGDRWGFAALSGHACGVKEMPHPIEIFSRRRCAGLIV